MICFFFIKKTKKVMANLEQIHCDHRNALHNLEREKKVRGDRLRAAQVREEQD